MWDKEILTIRGDHLPGGALEVWYIEAFCRPGLDALATGIQDGYPPQNRTGRTDPRTAARSSCGLAWKTGSSSIMRSAPAAMKSIFNVVATNPGSVRKSLAHWAQPCIRVNRYAGTKLEHNSRDVPAVLFSVC